MRIFVWLIRAAIFFTLFAFALNNRDEATIHWFFEQQWRAPMVIIVLAAFALGCAFGIVAMVPSWWRHRRGSMFNGKAHATADGSLRKTHTFLLHSMTGGHFDR